MTERMIPVDAYAPPLSTVTVARNRWKGREFRDHAHGSVYISTIYMELNRATGN